VTPARKIFPRNLTARAAHRIAGNPDISRPEDVVANCFPGLDMDLRNLDRRFFPGLVFEFIGDDVKWAGARLLYCDALGDADLQPDYLSQLDAMPPEIAAIVRERQQVLLAEMTNPNIRIELNSGSEELRPNVSRCVMEAEEKKGIWFLDAIEQNGRVIDLNAQPDSARNREGEGWGEPLDGQVVWRLVRGLDPGAVTIVLRRRHAEEDRTKEIPPHDLLWFEGWRRWYTGPLTGVLSGAYQPGELTMTMCSPWQHDFRDCACHYWASNRPDVVHGEVAEGENLLPGGDSANPERATRRLDWMRAERRVEAAALKTMSANRPFQMDHFQISHRWQDLNIVLRNTEIGAVYTPPPADPGTPFDTPAELYDVLHDRLAGLEMTLALEYLYASFSLIPGDTPVPGWPEAHEHAEMARHYLRLTAISEMQHLRWANELLWALAEEYFPPGHYQPALDPALTLPTPDLPGLHRFRALRSLTLDVLDEFIAVERPSGGINGAYTRVVATLALDGYSPHLHQLASRIANDGTEHFSRFENLRLLLEPYDFDQPAYLRPNFVPGEPSDPAVANALRRFTALRSDLATGYGHMAAKRYSDAEFSLRNARVGMQALLADGEALAATGFGIPFWWP